MNNVCNAQVIVRISNNAGLQINVGRDHWLGFFFLKLKKRTAVTAELLNKVFHLPMKD